MHFRSGRQLFVPALKLIDLAIMAAAFGVASWVISTDSFLEILAERYKIANFLLFLGLLLIWHLILAGFGLYRPRRLSSGWADAFDALKATTVGSLALFNAGIFLQIGLISSRFIALFWVASTVMIVLSRMLLPFALARLRRQGRNLRYVLIVGTNERALRFARKLGASPELGYRLVGFADEDWAGLREFNGNGGKLVARLDTLRDFLRHNVIDEVVIGLPLQSSYGRCRQIVQDCEEQGITVRFLSDLFDLTLARASVEEFEQEPVITLHTGAMSGPGVAVKRGLDFSISLALLVIQLPLFVVIAVLIKLTSPGPVFFIQERVGLNKRKFRLYKFRTMVADAEERLSQIEHLNEVSGPVFKIEQDPRLTPVGRFLRKTSLDEMPQLLNVIKGDMSLVGPRPLPVRDYQGFSEDWHRRRFSVRPGLTCLWQIAGRNEIPFEQWMELDMEYIDHWSIGLDLKILLQTIPVVVRGSGAA